MDGCINIDYAASRVVAELVRYLRCHIESGAALVADADQAGSGSGRGNGSGGGPGLRSHPHRAVHELCGLEVATMLRLIFGKLALEHSSHSDIRSSVGDNGDGGEGDDGEGGDDEAGGGGSQGGDHCGSPVAAAPWGGPPPSVILAAIDTYLRVALPEERTAMGGLLGEAAHTARDVGAGGALSLVGVMASHRMHGVLGENWLRHNLLFFRKFARQPLAS